MRNSVRSETARAGSVQGSPGGEHMQKEMSWCRWRRWQIDCRDQSQGVAGPERPNAHNRKTNRSRNVIAVVNRGADAAQAGWYKAKGGQHEP